MAPSTSNPQMCLHMGSGKLGPKPLPNKHHLPLKPKRPRTSPQLLQRRSNPTVCPTSNNSRCISHRQPPCSAPALLPSHYNVTDRRTPHTQPCPPLQSVSHSMARPQPPYPTSPILRPHRPHRSSSNHHHSSSNSNSTPPRSPGTTPSPPTALRTLPSRPCARTRSHSLCTRLRSCYNSSKRPSLSRASRKFRTRTPSTRRTTLTAAAPPSQSAKRRS